MINNVRMLKILYFKVSNLSKIYELKTHGATTEEICQILEIDVKNKTFRPLPNFDMEKSCDVVALSSRYDRLEELYTLFPKEYERLLNKMCDFVFAS